jgi:hypothetical protein
VSAHLGEVLRRADALLVEWSAFGAAVRGQVEREVATIGDAVGAAVERTLDAAVARGVASSLERAIAEQLDARIAGLAAELAKLEHRAQLAADGVSGVRARDRRLLGAHVLGVLVANALLALLLVRTPRAQAPSPEAARIIAPRCTAPPATVPATATPPILAPPSVSPPSVSPPSVSPSQPALPASEAAGPKGRGRPRAKLPARKH